MKHSSACFLTVQEPQMTIPATFFQQGSFPGVLLPLSPEPSDASEGGSSHPHFVLDFLHPPHC